MPTQPNTQPPAGPDQGGAPQQENQNQDVYDIFVSQGILMLSKLKIKITKSPEMVAQTMVMIVKKVVMECEKQGIKLPIEVLLHGSKEILIALIQQSGIEFSEADVKTIVGNMIGLYLDGEVKAGRMTPEEVSALGQQAKQSMGGGEGGPPTGGQPAGPAPQQQPPPTPQPGGGLLGGMK